MDPFRFDSSDFTAQDRPWWPSQWRDAAVYDCDENLRMAMELAINLHRPLLVTGSPGCGKTTAAYWAALKLGKRPPPQGSAADTDEGVTHTQVRSSTTEKSIKYSFDAIGFFREVQSADAAAREDLKDPLVKERRFFQKGPLWRAFEAPGHVVLLFDEIDKAPPELPNDLLLELDRFRFEVPELPGRVVERSRDRRGEDGKPLRFLVLVTSNGQRPLPDAFLRRCLHHRISMDADRMTLIATARRPASLPKKDLDKALALFLKETANRRLEHVPGLSELLDWLYAIDLELQRSPEREREVRTALDGGNLDKLPFQTLFKKEDDVDRVLAKKKQA